MNRSKKIVLLIIGVVILVALGVLFIHTHRLQLEYDRANVSYSFSSGFNSADSLLFNTAELQNLIPVFQTFSDIRPVLKQFQYKDMGFLFYTIILLNDDKSWAETIFIQNEEYRQAKRGIGAFGLFETTIAQTKVEKVDSIICSYIAESDLLQEEKFNDNFHSFYGIVQSFSLRYGQNMLSDMSFQPPLINSKRTPVPFVFAFLKKGTTVYFINFIPKSVRYVIGRDYTKEIWKDFGKSWIFNSDSDEVLYKEIPSDFLRGIINY